MNSRDLKLIPAFEARLAFDLANAEKPWIVGIDEVGWGCIAGELVLGAVLIHKEFFDELRKKSQLNSLFLKVRDSKKLTLSLREELVLALKPLQGKKFQVIYGIASVAEINVQGLAQAFDLCVNRILEQLPTPNTFTMFLDGNRVPPSLKAYQVKTFIKGDDKSIVIGLASIHAKTYRDELVTKQAQLLADYDLIENKGYGTANHIKGLKTYGISSYHRQKSTTTILTPK